jgi:glycosyltransferase involved in cell wall biosynthesis
MRECALAPIFHGKDDNLGPSHIGTRRQVRSNAPRAQSRPTFFNRFDELCRGVRKDLRRQPQGLIAMADSFMRGNGKALFLISPSKTPCGVEMFARGLLKSCRAIGIDARAHALAGRLREAPDLWRATADVSALVVNLPVVAWKRALLTPALALAIARLRGVQTTIVMHEWADLDWRRRMVIAFYLLLAQTILFSSPVVRAQFERSLIGWLPFAKGLVPIPANISRPAKLPSTPLTERLVAEKARGRLILGHFGSIYPKKRSSFVLDIAAELKRRGVDVFVVFIGSFIKGNDGVEAEFNDRAKALALEGNILVTGYVDADAEIFALFDCVDTFVYSFAEGLSSRRGSVLACLQSGRQVVVNAPATAGEFDHHPTFLNAMAQPILRFAPTHADAEQFAIAIVSAERTRAAEPLKLFESSWRDAAFALRAAVALRPSVLTGVRTAYARRSSNGLLAAKAGDSFESRS